MDRLTPDDKDKMGKIQQMMKGERKEYKKVKVNILDDEKEVTIDSKGGGLNDVTISWNEPWGEELHNVEFEQGDSMGDAEAYDEAMTWEYTAESEDGMWKFMVHVGKDPNEDADTIWNIEWDYLEIDKEKEEIYKVGDKVLALMRGTKANGHQNATITGIDKEDGVLRKTDNPETLLSVYSEEEDLEDEIFAREIKGFSELNEGSCGTKDDTTTRMREVIKNEIKKLHETDYADRLANSGTDSDGRNTWGDKTGYSDKEMAQGKGKLKNYPDKDGRNVWGDKTDYSDKEKANKFDHSKFDFQEKVIKASFVYTEQGGRFYSLTLSTSDDRQIKLKYGEANAWLKDTLEYIHEGDLIPRHYGSGLEDLDLIVDRLKELGIESSHGDYMDVS